MNYYIQGNKEKADQIKAAFEKLGYNTGYLGFTSGQLYYTVEGKVELMCIKSLQNLAGGEYGYQYAIDKACEWLKNHSETDYYELIPNANYCGAVKLNKNKMIEDLCKAMEE